MFVSICVFVHLHVFCVLCSYLCGHSSILSILFPLCSVANSDTVAEIIAFVKRVSPTPAARPASTRSGNSQLTASKTREKVQVSLQTCVVFVCLYVCLFACVWTHTYLCIRSMHVCMYIKFCTFTVTTNSVLPPYGYTSLFV